MIQYSEMLNIRISKEQKDILEYLKKHNFKVARFIRQAIQEKLEQEKVEIITNYKESLDECPF